MPVTVLLMKVLCLIIGVPELAMPPPSAAELLWKVLFSISGLPVPLLIAPPPPRVELLLKVFPRMVGLPLMLLIAPPVSEELPVKVLFSIVGLPESVEDSAAHAVTTGAGIALKKAAPNNGIPGVVVQDPHLGQRGCC